MKLLLKDFQTTAVDNLVRHLHRAAREAKSGDLQAVSLSSPTGSGKTVMITAAIEKLLAGDDIYAPLPDATFLWVTDQPSLNEQTRRKMADASSVLGSSNLVVIDATFDQETFSPGIIYFLNVQKLGKERDLVTWGDKRRHTIWETITNTVASRPGQFFVIVDEAHRGMSESQRARNEATTIIQKFIKGSPGEIPPVPLVVGISATLARFHALIQGTARTTRSVEIDPEDVRASGLLKEVITLYHPDEDQPSDMTMLRAAARSWRTFSDRWRDYCQAEGEAIVRPLFVVQVQDKVGTQVSKTNIGEAIGVLDDEVGPLPPAAYAHAFQEEAQLTIGGRTLRYLAPPNIQNDPDVQVVFFKISLNTGWDCPRAETMMSFRTAVDATLIAQLVGRMVRTPLARRINADEHLNTVALYLPHYDRAGLAQVINQLTTPDPDIMPPVRVERGDEVVLLSRATDSDDAFAALASLPSYTIPQVRKTSEVRRLMKLGRQLANDKIDEDAVEKSQRILLDVLDAHYEASRESERFKTIVEEKGQLEVRAVNLRLGADADDDAETIQLDIASENVDDLFQAAGRKIGEGLHKAWWRARVKASPSARTAAKLELFALATDTATTDRMEEVARQTVQQWLHQHRAAITALPEGRRQEYDEIRRRASRPSLAPISYPETIDGKKADTAWPKHLYVDGRSMFPAKFNTWETAVIQEEVERSDVVAWLRNLDRKEWSLTVPYEDGGETRALYPDFLAIRETPEGLIVDLLDPHSVDLVDAPAKAAGLARYAGDYCERFGRIELIIKDGDKIKRLDLTSERIRDKVKEVKTQEHLRQLFDLLWLN